MSMTDPVADMLTRIRNACSAGHRRVDVPASKLKVELARLLLENHYIAECKVLEDGGYTIADLDWFVPHQANKRIIDATARRMGVGPEKVMLNIERYGNTTSGTIPLCLWDYEKQLHKGDNLILAAFGGGFTWGSVWVKWRLEAGRL